MAARHFLIKFSIQDKTYHFVFFVALISCFSYRESIFWMAGGFTYGIAAAIFLFLIAQELLIFLDFMANKKNPALWKIGNLCLMTLILAGFNETVMVAHIALLGQLFIILAYQNWKSRVTCMIGAIMLTAVIGALIVKYAPGNLTRMNDMSSQNVMASATKSFGWIFERYTHIFIMTWLLFYSSLIVFYPRKPNKSENKYLLLIIAILFFTLWASLFTRAYVLNGSGPSRTHTIDFVILSLAAFIAALYIFNSNMEAVFQSRRLKPIFISFSCMFFVALILRPTADNISFLDTLVNLKYSKSLKTYMSARIQMAQNGRDTALSVDDLKDKSRPATYFDDIQKGSKDWRNVCFSNYFHLKEIRLKNSLSEPDTLGEITSPGKD
ncbi:DUF6056 family protein [Actimicrobium sp. CCI2.3]|uniref:DUF6056 family protein n=1 Tax=Actimicrobium sp. CCI2.3 TaxID=3048616 RepID=UPI002AB5BD10|nr:DUF6056 family protein [Actimicrobium sp. CCI2.3]MDY7575617.1 DUF6056 family protein [Actimicrobium sp. CCI2.3]